VTIERVLVVDARHDFPEKGQTMADVRIKAAERAEEFTARCVVEFKDWGAYYVQQDFPIGSLPNIWWAVKEVMTRVMHGESPVFPIDVTAEVLAGPW